MIGPGYSSKVPARQSCSTHKATQVVQAVQAVKTVPPPPSLLCDAPKVNSYQMLATNIRFPSCSLIQTPLSAHSFPASKVKQVLAFLEEVFYQQSFICVTRVKIQPWRNPDPCALQ